MSDADLAGWVALTKMREDLELKPPQVDTAVMSLIAGADRGLWPYPFGMDQTPSWVMPWLAPGPIALQALAALPCPLRACVTGFTFDAEENDELWREVEERSRNFRAALREIRDLGDRLEWRIELAWALDVESPPEEVAAYEKVARSVAGVAINPRCLEDYVVRAYDLMASVGMDYDNPHWTLDTDPEIVAVHREALNWAQAGVVVLQQSLPWPFVGVLPWSIIDNRPAHRALFAYASLLRLSSPKKAKPWFRAMLYMNPNDNMGVRDFL